MNHKIEKLREQNEKDKTRLEQLLHEQQRLKNRLSYLEKGERQKRAHRLITKGAAIESLAPATKDMGEASFPCFRRVVINNRTLSFSRHANQEERWAVGYRSGGLPRRRETT